MLSRKGQSPLELQLIWLDKVCAFAQKHHRTPILWDDMPLKLAGVYKTTYQEMPLAIVDSIWDRNESNLGVFLKKLPKNCVLMRWNYKSPQVEGNIRTMDWYMKNHIKIIEATAAQTRWVLMPQNQSNIKNIKRFAKESINKKLEGLLLTLWDDDSPHFELYFRGILAFAFYKWSGEKIDIDGFKSLYRQSYFSYRFSDDKYGFIDQMEPIVAFWKNLFLNGNKRNYLKAMSDADREKALLDLSSRHHRGAWSKSHSKLIKTASLYKSRCDTIAKTIERMKYATTRNAFGLQVYELVNKLLTFDLDIILKLHAYDIASDENVIKQSLKELLHLRKAFDQMRASLEKVYSQSRILNKPHDYILDDDHHVHLANQSINFDWQFLSEILFIEKIAKELAK